jgi:hypothetical protein
MLPLPPFGTVPAMSVKSSSIKPQVAADFHNFDTTDFLMGDLLRSLRLTESISITKSFYSADASDARISMRVSTTRSWTDFERAAAR